MGGAGRSSVAGGPHGARGGRGDLDVFLRLVGKAARQPGASAAREAMVGWLHRALGVEVAIVDGFGPAPGPGSGSRSGPGSGSGSGSRSGSVEVATAGFPSEIPGLLRPLLLRVAHGQVARAASSAGSFQVLLEPVGTRPPRAVLIVAGDQALPYDARSRVAHAGSLMAALGRAGEAEQAALAYRRKAHQVRLGVYMALMTGDVMLARRMTVGNVPPLLDAERLRVCVLRCEPVERDLIAEAYEDSSGYHGSGLIVRCPVYDEHLICAFREDAEEPAPGRPEDGARGDGGDRGDHVGTAAEDTPDYRGLPEALRRLVEEQSQHPLGISHPQPIDQLGTAYEEARHALAATVRGARRVAIFDGQPNLARMLPAETARRWARSLLAPLASAPEQTVVVTGLALQFPRAAVARLLGISRNTVTAHVRRAEEALGLDLNAVGTRAALALALSVTSPSAAEAGPDDGTRPRLAPAFHTDAVGAWAAAFLRPLERHEHRLDLWATLREWIASDADAQRAARSLGISRNTVAAHLHTAERLLGRDLLTLGNGVYDLVHALHITGRIPPPPLLR